MTDTLADRFEAHRAHLRAVAYRMLGSATEADDAVQEAWLRLTRSTPDDISNLGGWLTTVVARICLDMLRTRTARREDPLDAAGERPAASDANQELMLADSVGLALMFAPALIPTAVCGLVLERATRHVAELPAARARHIGPG